jgi:hypothetical protein
MKVPIALAILLSAVPAITQRNLDDQFRGNPPVRRNLSGGYEIDKDNLPDNPQPRVFSKAFLIGHGIYLASNVFDIEMTHQGLAHHRCVEGGFDGGQHPSRGELYRGDLPVFGFLTFMDILFKMEYNRPDIRTKWLVWMPFSFAGWGTMGHLRGGIKWYTDCW